MSVAIIITLSNLATMLATAWLLHRKGQNLPPLSLPAAIETNAEEVEEEQQQVQPKGRPVL